MKKAIYIFIAIILGFFISGLIPMNNSKENCVEVTGVVKSVAEGGIKDLVFELENDKITFYINRGFENGFNLAKAKKDFDGKKITLFYVDSWSLLAPFGTKSKHIAHLTINDTVVYNEW